MPRFYFHLRTSDGLDRDDDGIDAPDLEAAYLEACRSIPPLSAELMDDGMNPLACAFEIADAAGRALMEVPFDERLRGRRHRPARPGRADPPAVAVAGIGRRSSSATQMRAGIAEIRAASERTRELAACTSRLLWETRRR